MVSIVELPGSATTARPTQQHASGHRQSRQAARFDCERRYHCRHPEPKRAAYRQWQPLEPRTRLRAAIASPDSGLPGRRWIVPHRTASNPGSILPDHPPFSTLHPKRSDWRPLRARSKRSIRLPMARGSSNAPFLSDRMRKTWRNEAENDKITPRDHVPISKTYLLQQHRQMGVVKQDCSDAAIVRSALWPPSMYRRSPCSGFRPGALS